MPWPPSRTTLVPLHRAVSLGARRDFHSEGKLHATRTSNRQVMVALQQLAQ